MSPFKLISICVSCYELAVQIARLPVASLHFDPRLDPEHIRQTYHDFTRPHPRYRVFQHKALGAALVDLRAFATRKQYLESVAAKGHAGPQSRKALARGYRLRQISREDHVDDIHAINISSELRQGRPMDDAYTKKQSDFDVKPHFRYYGIFSASGKLVAYCNVAVYGNFAAPEQLLGYKNGDGVMYFLLAYIIGELIEEAQLDYFMYDTMLRGHAGLRDFKRRVGFAPYRARYAIKSIGT